MKTKLFNDIIFFLKMSNIMWLVVFFSLLDLALIMIYNDPIPALVLLMISIFALVRIKINQRDIRIWTKAKHVATSEVFNQEQYEASIAELERICK